MSTPFSKAQYKRKTVSMFSEGSVFKQTIQGNLVSVTPEILEKKDFHPVYRNGLAFTVPILA
ncbi:hypothetical protein [Candidatus Kuenenia stuttgartiensis]|nr:hypothetical protein [Candidatus Kuenenia stuttgartiensis]